MEKEIKFLESDCSFRRDEYEDIKKEVNQKKEEEKEKKENTSMIVYSKTLSIIHLKFTLNKLFSVLRKNIFKKQADFFNGVQNKNFYEKTEALNSKLIGNKLINYLISRN